MNNEQYRKFHGSALRRICLVRLGDDASEALRVPGEHLPGFHRDENPSSRSRQPTESYARRCAPPRELRWVDKESTDNMAARIQRFRRAKHRAVGRRRRALGRAGASSVIRAFSGLCEAFGRSGRVLRRCLCWFARTGRRPVGSHLAGQAPPPALLESTKRTEL